MRPGLTIPLVFHGHSKTWEMEIPMQGRDENKFTDSRKK